MEPEAVKYRGFHRQLSIDGLL